MPTGSDDHHHGGISVAGSKTDADIYFNVAHVAESMAGSGQRTLHNVTEVVQMYLDQLAMSRLYCLG